MTRDSNRRRWRRVLPAWAIFVVVGLGVGLTIGGPAARATKVLELTLIMGAIGSPIVRLQVATSLRAPITAIVVGADGIVAKNGRGKEFRYRWDGRSLHIHLGHRIVGEEADPIYRPSGYWNLAVRPPACFGEVPRDCYERMIGIAAMRGLEVQQRRIRHAGKVGSFETQDSFIRRRWSSSPLMSAITLPSQ